MKDFIMKIILKDMERNKKGKPSIISYLALIVSLISLILTIICR